MSFNGFDDNINNAPEKTVFDERQKTLQLRFGVEALTIFAFATFMCCASLDFVYKWTESTACVVLLTAVLSLIWYLIRCAVKGCMVAVSGKRAQKISYILVTVGSVLQSVRFFFEISEENFIIKDGMLSINFLFFASLLLLFGCGIFSLYVIHSEEKRNESEEQK
ncbi:MAG: hypothetical protein K2J80_03875 [Oscillospiraceae bacterium]|nr:hypothetical protein [Oscillospiraceae bacterium]